jgi:hypothetical protein
VCRVAIPRLRVGDIDRGHSESSRSADF